MNGRLLRYYEEQGLLRPDRLPSGYRDYDESAVETVHRIRTLLRAGLPTATIADVLPCMVGPALQLRPTCPQLLTKLQAERERIDATIDSLRQSRNLLDDVIAASSAGIDARRSYPAAPRA